MNIKYQTKQVDELVIKMSANVLLLENSFSHGVSIYGAGFVGAWASRYLVSHGATINNFFDRDPQKNGSTVNKIPVVPPTSEAMSSVAAMFIAARHAVSEVQRGFAHLDCVMMSFDAYFICKNYERLATVRDNFFDDDRSIETFNALLIAMLTSSTKSCLSVMEKDMYFCLPEFSGNFEEIFIDCLMISRNCWSVSSFLPTPNR